MSELILDNNSESKIEPNTQPPTRYDYLDYSEDNVSATFNDIHHNNRREY